MAIQGFLDRKQFAPVGLVEKVGHDAPRPEFTELDCVTAWACAVRIMGSDEALVENCDWAGNELTARSLAAEFDHALPGRLIERSIEAQQPMDAIYKNLRNMVYRMCWVQRDYAEGLADEARRRRTGQHPTNWPNWQQWQAVHDHVRRFSTPVPVNIIPENRRN